jgi:tRNA A22 N-methylase
VASPQKDVRLFREGLAARRFSIIRETMLEEIGKYYPVILAERKNEGIRELSYDEALLGPCLMKEMSPVFLSYLKKRRRVLEEILKSVPASREDRRSEAGKELDAISRVLNRL